MTQLFLACVVILAGVVLGVTELTGGRRRRADSARELAVLRDLVRRKADTETMKTQVEVVREGLATELGVLRGEVASALTEARDLGTADLRSTATVLRDEFDQSRQETLREIAETADRLKTAIEGSRQESVTRVELVIGKLGSLAREVKQNHERAHDGLATLEKRLAKVEKAQQVQDDRLTRLEGESWAAVNGEIDCKSDDVGGAVENVLLRLAGSAGLSLVSSRVLKSAPLKARYWFAGVDDAEFADWLVHAKRAEAPEVTALFEIVKTMEAGTVTLGSMRLRGASGWWWCDIGAQHSDRLA
ncbi:hypothetical protein [Actinomadura sp. GTD37]|uniref:hypothetical protein n=1 Tax=Actinomadura sp. GTD37 TaxID=1778030 RepID=UPI0035BF3BDB